MKPIKRYKKRVGRFNEQESVNSYISISNYNVNQHYYGNKKILEDDKMLKLN